MRRAAELVLASLPALAREEDPGRPLAALPRQLERKDEPSAPLHEAIWGRILEVPFLAGAAGRLHRPAELRRPPVDEPELQWRWMRVAADDVADRYVHPTCFATPVRSARRGQLADQLVSGAWSASASLRDMPRLGKDEWFYEWLRSVASPDPGIGREVVLLAAEVARKHPALLSFLAFLYPELAIVPTADGELATVSAVAFPGLATEPTGMKVIHPSPAADEQVSKALRSLGVAGGDDAAWQRALELARPKDPQRGWDLIGAAPEPVRKAFIEGHRESLRFKTGGGQWRPAEGVLRRGSLIGGDEREANAAVAIDRSFAERYAPVLDQLGIGDLPREQWLSRRRSGEMDAFEKAADEHHRRVRCPGLSPYWNTLRIFDDYRSLEGADYLDRLHGLARARLTKLLLDRAGRTEQAVVRFGGVGSPPTEKKYPPISVPNPSIWKI